MIWYDMIWYDMIWYDMHLTLVWEYDWLFLEKYKKFIDSWEIILLWELSRKKLLCIFPENDILVNSSLSDSIWQVVLEAMSNGLAVLCSDTVWASDYLEKWKNWEIFKVNDSEDFEEKLIKVIKNLASYKENSSRILKEKYRYKNEKLMKEIYEKFEKFIS
jgi:glycosyltransferase involved in cell wall biosynthesis